MAKRVQKVVKKYIVIVGAGPLKIQRQWRKKFRNKSYDDIWLLLDDDMMGNVSCGTSFLAIKKFCPATTTIYGKKNYYIPIFADIYNKLSNSIPAILSVSFYFGARSILNKLNLNKNYILTHQATSFKK